MKTKVKVIILAATTAIALGALGTSFAASNNASGTLLKPLQQSAASHHKKNKLMKMHRKPQGKVWQRVLQPNRHLTKDNAVTITDAMILVHGQPGQKVGTVKQVERKQGRTFYKIKIMNKDNQVQRTILMNGANGHVRPVHEKKVK